MHPPSGCSKCKIFKRFLAAVLSRVVNEMVRADATSSTPTSSVDVQPTTLLDLGAGGTREEECG